MKQWVYIIFMVCVSGGVINMLAGGYKTEKHIRFICGICCVIAAISPIKGLMGTVEAFDAEEIVESVSLPDGNEYIARLTKEEIKQYISDYLLKNGINYSDISIEITVTDTETVVGDIKVYVPEESRTKAAELLKGIAEVVANG